MSETPPRLEVRGLSAWYGAAQVLHDVSFTVPAGAVLALLGRNGAGKSTTLRAVLGLVRRRSGTVRVDGRPVERLATHELARLGVGWVPEDRRVFTELTVDENLEVGRRPPRPGVPEWTPERLFALFPNLAEMRRRRAGKMSGGEQQMLSIARTLMGNPILLLLDEPSEGLAPRIVEQMADALAELAGSGLTVVLSEQNLPFARRLAGRVAVIGQGAIRFEGSFADFDADPSMRQRHLAV